ncbi:hypothetical protein BO996_16400 [Delftia sp. HK171]|uniref:hypothetical protein n=1 Tax=Delftia sp. HK171 TaxID=1920191 RepID=UPI0009041A89|nr:hypothetical protein [Delftia sp. HK171]APE49311.1 hypothetical protein BO996_16400 [Delftia sp. HK171]
MTMINTPMVLLAQQCGGTFHTLGPTRAIGGMCFTFEQLDTLAERLRSTDASTKSPLQSEALRQPGARHRNDETQ